MRDWKSDTGVPEPVIAFDCDGTLTDKGVTVIGRDDGRTWDLEPMRLMQRLGCRVAVMTCNHVRYVAAQLQAQGITAYADEAMEFRVPPWPASQRTVLVTNRKVLADLYPDDRGCHFAFGDNPAVIVRRIFGPSDPELDELVAMLSGEEDSNLGAETLIDARNVERGNVVFDPKSSDYNAYLIGC